MTANITTLIDRLAAGIPEAPGGLWRFLSKVAWADPDLARAHIIPFTADIQGVAGADGVAVTTPGQVIAHKYFFVREIDGFVCFEPGNVLERSASLYVNVQITDDERRFDLGRAAWNFGRMAGTETQPPQPLRYDDEPLSFLPNANIQVTWTPLDGFPVAVFALAVGGATTRRVGLTMHGMLVDAKLVDKLIDRNHELLTAAQLHPRSR